MTIEEKAKRYDEALTKARNIVNSINVGLIGKDSFEAVFPELRESEDERIRKWLIKDMGRRLSCWTSTEVTKEQVLAWLEKQGEQKSAWSEKDQEIWEEISVLLWEGFKKTYTKFSWNEIKDWIKPKIESLKVRAQSQSQWKPSDEQMGVIEAVINNRSFQRRHLDSLYEQLKKLKGE
jgi:hypothetical protein